ncbi:MAG: two-component regulator propeller domain-containing protein, partial [Candidatus Cryptobacteroides sp.]
MRLLLAILLSVGLGGRDFLFRNVGVEQGLSSNTVSSICQDRQGNIWLATKGGVNRYNGYDVDAFRFSADDPNTVQSNNINYICTGWDGSVWACTSDGLACFDAHKGFFRRIPLGHIHSVESIIQVSESAFLLCTRNDSYICDKARGSVTRAEIGGKRFAFFGSAYDRGTVMIGTGARNLEFLSYSDSAGFSRLRPPVRCESVINGILPAGGGACWLGTRGMGLCRYEPSRDSIVRVPLKNLPKETIETIAFDSDSLLWVGTKHGICVYDWRNGRDTMLTSDPYEVSGISSNAIRDAFRDADGNMWIGSTYGGVDVMCSRKHYFKTIRRRPDKNSLSDNIIRSMYADRDSTLWVGTRYFGLNRFDLRTGRISKICSHEHILSIFSPEWNPGVLYFGTYSNGIAAVDKRTGKVLREYESKDVNAMVPAGDGKIWVGGLSGLFLFDPVNGSMTKMSLVSDKIKIRIVSLMKDDLGRLWVGAKENLLCFEVSPDNVLTDVTPPALADVVRTQSLLQTRDGAFVIGTTDGLFSYINGVLERVPAKSGLRDLTINGMVEDRNGELWIVTGKGLCRYHPGWKTGRFYYADDGLQGDEFSQSGICADKDGNIFVGGFNGLSYFNPGEICVAPAPPAPVISKLRVHNAQVTPDDGSGILREDISLTGSIVLKHSQNSI